MSLEHSKTCGTCSAGVTYSVVNRVWQNAGYWRRCLLLNLHKVEILEILTLICGGPPLTEGALKVWASKDITAERNFSECVLRAKKVKNV